MKEWQLAEAKNRFSEVVNNALSQGPQIVNRRNDTVVIISKDEFDALTGNIKSFKDHIFDAPNELADISFDRDASSMRDTPL